MTIPRGPQWRGGFPLTRKPRGFAAASGALLLVIAGAALLLTSDHRHEVLGGDGPEYGRYAKNLVDHGVYSSESAPPYQPTLGRTPGYPLFLAAVRLVAGDSVLAVRLVQFALLGLLAALVFAIAMRVSGRREARLAALMTLTYLPLIWLARFQLTEVLASVLACAAVLLVLPARDGRSEPLRFAAVGVLLGFLSLVRPGYGLIAVPLAVGIGLTLRSNGPRSGWKLAAALIVAFGLTLTPWIVRNLVTAHEFVPLGAQSGISLYASAQQWDGTITAALTQSDFARLRADAAGVAAPLAERERRKAGGVPLSIRVELAADRAYRSNARSIMADVTVGEMLKRLPRRVAYLWAPSDFPPPARYSFWHRLAQVQHAALALFGLLGLIVLIRRRVPWRLIWPLVLFAVYLSLLHLVFHVEARYGIPARPMLLVISAIGAAAGFQWLFERLPLSRNQGTV